MINLGEAIYQQGYQFGAWVREALETDMSVEQILELGIQKGEELYIRDPATKIQEDIEERFGVCIFITKLGMEEKNLTLDEALARGEFTYREESVIRYYFSRNDELNDRVMEGAEKILPGAKKVLQRVLDDKRERAAAHAPQGDAKKP